MFSLFNIPDYIIDTSKFSHHLHGDIVDEFESNFKNYVGAKYACSINSATNAIFLALLHKNTIVNLPSMIPPVVCNAVLTSGNKINFVDNTEWVGDSYILQDFGEYKIIDSAQKVKKNQFEEEANDEDLIIFSFYPTKPIGGSDGGIIVSNDEKKIKWFKEATMNGMSYSDKSWNRKPKFPGFKMYMNSIQAYIANENLKKYDKKLGKLKEINYLYNKELGYNNKSYHLYRIEVDNNKEFIENMKKHSIICGIHYDPLHINPIYNNISKILLNSEKMGKKTISLPFHENLSREDVEFIINKIQNY